MATHNTDRKLVKLLISSLKVGLLGLGGGTNLVITQDQFVQKHKFCTQTEFHHAFSLIWLLPGPVATKLIVFLSYKTYPRWWIPFVTILCFSSPGFFILLGIYYLERFINQSMVADITTVIAFCFMFSFCLSSLISHVKENKARIGPSVFVIISSFVLAASTHLTLIQAMGIYALGFFLLVVTPKLQRRTHAFILDPYLWFSLLKGSLLVYGGVYGVIPYLNGQWVEKYKLVSSQIYWHGVGLGHIVPGPFANYITYIGLASAPTFLGALHGYLMGYSFMILPCLLVIPLVKLEPKLIHNRIFHAFFKYFFPFILPQIFYYAAWLSLDRTAHIGVVIGIFTIAMLKEILKLNFLSFLALSCGGGVLYHLFASSL